MQYPENKYSLFRTQEFLFEFEPLSLISIALLSGFLAKDGKDSF